MKKKFVAMLLVLATLLTLLPVTAMAADCNHNRYQKTYTCNNNYTHKIYCNSCHKTVEESAACTASNSWGSSGNTCQYCNGPVCKHNSQETVSNGDGTHSTKCKTCKAVTSTANCTFYGNSTQCWTCKGSKPCAHTYKTTTPNGDGTHSTKCNSCGVETAKGNCNYNNYTGKCYTCNGSRPCDHSLTVHTSNKDNTHDSKCACGQEVIESVACTFSGNRCTVCKDKRYCDHTLNDFAPDGKGNHSKSCDCGLEKTDPVKCTYGEDDLCTVCKGKNPCNHVADNITANGDGTHSTACDCGKVATDNVDCTFDAEGVCTICKGACSHANTTLVSNGAENHSNICDDCNVVLSTNRHYYNFFTHLCNCGDADPFFQKICPHKDYEVININNTSMHEVACRLCHLMRYYEPHGYNANGDCACGHSKGACTHTNIGHVSKGTENETICKDCGKVLESENLECTHKHEYNVFDICIHCGAVNPNEVDPNPLDPTEPAPTYPADAWNRLDDLFTTHK